MDLDDSTACGSGIQPGGRLRARSAPLVLSFLEACVIEENRGAVSAGPLTERQALLALETRWGR